MILAPSVDSPDYRIVGAVAAGFPVTASSFLAGSRQHHVRLNYTAVNNTGANAQVFGWCAASNAVGEWVQISNYDPSPLLWQGVSI